MAISWCREGSLRRMRELLETSLWTLIGFRPIGFTTSAGFETRTLADLLYKKNRQVSEDFLLMFWKRGLPAPLPPKDVPDGIWLIREIVLLAEVFVNSIRHGLLHLSGHLLQEASRGFFHLWRLDRKLRRNFSGPDCLYSFAIVHCTRGPLILSKPPFSSLAVSRNKYPGYRLRSIPSCRDLLQIVEWHNLLLQHLPDHFYVLPSFPIYSYREPSSADDTTPTMATFDRTFDRPREGRGPEERSMETILVVTTSLFRSRKALRESTFEKFRSHAKALLKHLASRPAARAAIGTTPQVWKDINQLLLLAIPILKAQSVCVEDAPPGSDQSTSALMALHHDTLITDLERLNDIVLLARDCIATVQRAQNLAGEKLVDQQILRLIELAVRVTAQGYDGEAGSRLEQSWANVTAGYKKLLITCLQFLHNLAMQNEQRKLLLWLDLFAKSKIGHDYTVLAGLGRDQFQAKLAANEAEKEERVRNGAAREENPSADDSLEQKMSKNTLDEKENIQERPNLLPRTAAKSKSSFTETSKSSHDVPTEAGDAETATNGEQSVKHLSINSNGTSIADTPQDLLFGPVKTERGDEFGPLKTPESAADTLQAAKNQLMARLADPSSAAEDNENTEAWAGADNDEGLAPAEDEDDFKDQESGDQQRGLLTDIPLVLGPSEIEALPMIIQMGIGAGHGSVLHGKDMQGMRCNILLAGEAGRNLLRELLIFIAAWDLQDDELYFKLMMQIMEAVLDNGLMPYAYQTFAEIKDIVSPAQSMVIKILTQIFRGKKEDQDKKEEIGNDKERDTAKVSNNPHSNASRRVDIYIVRYIFTIFRSSIIPETCALIYLQGQIKAGAAHPDDFPLNLWDMERVYEGVYQFLEFFAVLTESEQWKELLVNWEIVSELVTLLRELEASIPKAPLNPGSIPQTVSEAYNSALQQQAQQMSHLPGPEPVPIAVERPFEVSPPPPAAGSSTAPAGAYPAASPFAPNAEPSEEESVESSEPSDFEWRNLKKLVILVLSSLVWKSANVQEQIRKHGGVQLVIACCNLDGNNPYIKEHAVMCLRFLLENDRENQEILMGLQQMGKWKTGQAGQAADLGDVDGRARVVEEEGTNGQEAEAEAEGQEF